MSRTPTLLASVDRQAMSRLTIDSRGNGLVEFTHEAAAFVAESGIGDGLFTAFCRHTSASLLIQENADPDVGRDLLTALDRLAPQASGWRHDTEGPDDMPAHIRAMLTGASLTVPVIGGQLALGSWQGLFLAEHRTRPHRRDVLLQVIGTSG